MFKKTVVMMALVMMSASAFAGPEIRSEVRDEKRTEQEARDAGLSAAKEAGIKDARAAGDIGELVRDSAVQDQKDHTGKAKALADALNKVRDNSRTVGGKVIRASDVIASLSSKVRSLRASGKMTVERTKRALFETQFVALAFRGNVKDMNSKGSQIAAKEASLASMVIDPSWDGSAATSHENLQKSIAREMQGGSQIDVAAETTFKKTFGDDATKRAEDDIHCE